MRNILKIALPLVGISAAAMASADVLQSVTFWVGANSGTTIDYEAQVYAWNGSLYGGNPMQGAVGAALYNSGFSIYNGTGALTPVTFAPNINLGVGSYVALLTTVGGNGTGYWGLVPGHVAGDGGGGFNFYNNGVGGAVATGNWDDFGDFGDAAWTATFGSGKVFDTTYAFGGNDVQPWGSPNTGTYGQTFVTPEPASFLPVALGVIGLIARRRKKA